MAKNPTRNKGNKMSSTNDALAALGLADEAPVAAAAETAAPATEAAADAAPAEREEVEIGALESGFLDFIPTSKRGGGASGSKYKFDELAAPTNGDNGKVNYAYHKVLPAEGADEIKFKRSVQSATTQANTRSKDNNEGKYFVTRTIAEGGKFVGMYIIRTDAPPAAGEDEAE